MIVRPDKIRRIRLCWQGPVSEDYLTPAGEADTWKDERLTPYPAQRMRPALVNAYSL